MMNRKPNEKGSKLKRGRQVATTKIERPTRGAAATAAAAASNVDDVLHRHMDDDELKKATSKKSGASLVRRYSDLSSSSGSTARSAASARNIQTAAKLAEKIPETFGKSDHEVRVTRGKLKTLLEPSSSQDDETTTKSSSQTSSASTSAVGANRLTRRNSRRQQQPQTQLEQVNENEELQPTKMSVHNLRKHNAAMEKLNEDKREVEEEDTKQTVMK